MIFDVFPSIFNFFHGGTLPKKSNQICLADFLVVILLFIISLSARSYKIDQPNSVVFDESYFAYFLERYYQGLFFFDIHPPFGRLFYFFTEKLVGYQFNCNPRVNFNYSSPNCDYITTRISPAFFGSLVSPFLYIAIRILGPSPLPSFACAFILSLDGSFLVHSKYALIDSFLHFFSAVSILTLFATERMPPLTCRWWILIIINAIITSLTSCIKHTALGLLAFSAFAAFIHSRSFRAFITRLFILLISYMVIMYITTLVHVALLPYHGPDESFLSNNYSSYLTLVNDPPLYRTIGLRNYTRSLFYRMSEIITLTFSSTNRVPPDHPSVSYWYEWPLAINRPVHLYSKGNSAILAISNPISTIISTISFLYSLLTMKTKTDSLLVVGYLCCWLPFIFIKRACFAYHYAIPLEISLCLLAYNLSKLPDRAKGFASAFLVLSALAVFWWFKPLYYAEPVENPYERLFFSRWRSIGGNAKTDTEFVIPYLQKI